MTANRQPTIIQGVHNKRLFAPLFKNLDTWFAWLVWLKAVFGLPMDSAELELFQKCTGRTAPPPHGAKEAYSIVGRRGGKSRIVNFVAVFIACLCSFAPHLVAGERGMVLILARDRDQAKVVFNYIKGTLKAVPLLKQMVVAWRADEIELNNSIIIAVKTSDYRTIRGVTVICAICDEVAFWDSQGVNPDKEVFAALRPAMATIPEAKLLVISTGYAMTGVLFDMHKEFFGKDDDEILIWQASSLTMNPTLSESMIQRELEKDPQAARAEWGGLFREDIEAAFTLEMIESCIIPDRVQLPATAGVAYVGFTDASGGRRDHWVTAVAHAHGEKIILDAIHATKPPFSPADTAKDHADFLKSYGITGITGDAYAGEWPREQFAKNGVGYEVSEKNKSQLYLELIPALTSKKVELLDNDKLKNELRRLERRRGRSGKDSIDHPAYGGSDDIANSVAGVIWLASDRVVDLSDFVEANSLAPERSFNLNRGGWLNQDETDDLHPVDKILDNALRGGGFWDL
jgi:hypothetical protein